MHGDISDTVLSVGTQRVVVEAPPSLQGLKQHSTTTTQRCMWVTDTSTNVCVTTLIPKILIDLGWISQTRALTMTWTAPNTRLPPHTMISLITLREGVVYPSGAGCWTSCSTLSPPSSPCCRSSSEMSCPV